MIIGLFGVLLAGGAYLPLDPALPDERIAFLLADAGAVALLTAERLAGRRLDFSGPVVFLEQERKGVRTSTDAGGISGAGAGARADHLAYVLYTSGSTGRPKGVLIDQGSLASFTRSAIEAFALRPGDRMLQFASLAFDTSAEEIYSTLLAGATLVLRTEAMHSSPALFFDTCRDWGITVLDLPTAYWHVLAAEISRSGAAPPQAVRAVIVGGERVLPERVRGWFETVGSYPLLFNTYGPTEATVASTGGVVSAPAAAGTGATVPIGRPMPNTRLSILDASLNPVPIGVAGELHIAGRGLARGYSGRPDLTARSFIPSPFGEPGSRLYRSGDLVRYLPDGVLDFVGRIDDQVKIRGFRVEPGEIATLLTDHPAVREAAVLATTSAAGDWRLTAYFVADGPPEPTPGELRDFLKTRLPAYMVPSDYLALPAMPMTATGKLDRAALPAPDRERDDGYVAPTTVSEELLADIWRALLDRERVSIYDNFFDLGGHSLLAPQLMSRIEEVFQIELPLRLLFEFPTVAQLAVTVEGALLAQIESLDDEDVAASEWVEAG
jgi:amino acid adenylation domain-containing protein